MVAFIDDHRKAHGVEPICKVLPIAPYTYHAHVAKRADPMKLSGRARRDLALKVAIRRVFADNFEVYGVRKVWLLLNREGTDGRPLHGGPPDARHGPDDGQAPLQQPERRPAPFAAARL